MKHNFSYFNDELYFRSWATAQADHVPLKQHTKNYRKPIYLYDLDLVQRQFILMQQAIQPVHLHYAMKANFHPEILRKIKALGGGVDTVSWGEIAHALQNGFLPNQIVFSGVGKTIWEVDQAIDTKIHQFNVESLSELKRLRDRCQLRQQKADVVLRINPNVSVDTHPYIATGLKDNKFGIGVDELAPVLEVLKSSSQFLQFVGLSSHLGSQIVEFSGIADALEIQKNLFCDLKRTFSGLKRFDIGGGVGIQYQDQDFDIEDQLLDNYGQVVRNIVAELEGKFPGEIEFQSEPGRFLVAHAGVLLCQVQYVKRTQHKTFVILDSGMNHLMRPSLYQAYHPILPLVQRSETEKYDFVGPICESSDFFAKDRMCTRIEEGDFVAVGCVGAYGASMANNYNLHEMPEEIVIGK